MNNNVIYIDYLNSYLDVLNSKFPMWIRKFVYRILNFFGYIKVKENRFILYCIPKDVINEKMINNLKEKLLVRNSKDIVLSELMLKNSAFVSIIKNMEYNILEGKWLYKFLCYDIIKKISEIKNISLNNLELTILSNDDSDINIENIKILAKEVKILNIVTENPRVFKVVEEYIYAEYGNIINVSTNKEKTCKYSDIICNFDFSIESLRKCKFKNATIIVQFTKEEFENRKGVTILFYKLNMPVKYIKLFNDYTNYNEEIFYESLLYYKTSFQNLKKILKEDNISIKYFIGCNGKIPFREIIS